MWVLWPYSTRGFDRRDAIILGRERKESLRRRAVPSAVDAEAAFEPGPVVDYSRWFLSAKNEV